MQHEILAYEGEQGFPEDLHEDGGHEVATSGYGASKDVESACGRVGPHRKIKLRRRMAAAPGQKSTTSLSLFMEAFGLEVEEELSTLATQYRAEAAWIGKWCLEKKEAWMNQFFEGPMWRQVRGPAGAVMYETRDLGIKWPH